jgi:membrane-bound serine protease (ClpP class)
MRKAFLAALILGLTLIAPAALAQPERAVVDLIELEGVIDPTSSDYLRGRLAAAGDEDVHAVIIRMDTPGGLDISMRQIVQDELDSSVPVIVWVAPRGARAASAGTFIAYAAHLAFMAEATEMGAASPVDLGGDTSDVLQEKIENDAAAFLREIALARGRNPDWAEDAVRDAAAIGATEAAQIDVVDGIASSLRELLLELDGRTVEIPPAGTEDIAGSPTLETTLETWDTANNAPSVTVRFQEMNLFQRLLHTITDPNLAFFLLLLGMFGIIFEIYNPGIGLGGILGAIALLLGFYALSVLPTNWAGVLLIALAVVFFIVDLHIAGLGIWTVGGTAALIAGGLLLFSGTDLRVSGLSLAGAVGLTLLFFISVMTAALRVRLRRPITGEEGIVGMVGEAKTDIAPEGTVMTKGTLWRARTMETGIAAGSKVKVMATEGLILLVEPLHDHEEVTQSGPQP